MNRFTLTIMVLLFFGIAIRADNGSLKYKLSEVDNVEIHFFKGKQGNYKTRKLMDLLYLKELITKAKNNSDLQCDTSGEIIYFNNLV